MYDTINFWLPKDEIGIINLDDVLNSLQDVTEHRNSNSDEYYSGKLDNYRVNISESGISLKGSLAKHYLKDNLNTLTRSDTKKAIENMADLTSLPIPKATVTRIDAAKNYIMKHKPEAYYNYLGTSNYYKRLPNASTLYYKNKLREKLFYDKIQESKAKKVKLPDIAKGKNILRFELRYMKRLTKAFGQKVKASTLYDEAFYMNINDRYLDEYKKINKFNNINSNFTNMKSPKDFHKQLELTAIKHLGQDKVMALIESMKQQKTFDKPEYYSRLKKDIMELCNSPDQTDKSVLIQELDSKIENSMKYYK